MKVVCPHCNKEFDYRKPKKSYLVGAKDPFSKLKTIINYLKIQENWVWIRRIAKDTKLKPFSVSYLIEKYLVNYVDMLAPEEVLESTGIKMKMWKLKNRDIDADRIIEDLKKRNNT